MRAGRGVEDSVGLGAVSVGMRLPSTADCRGKRHDALGRRSQWGRNDGAGPADRVVWREFVRGAGYGKVKAALGYFDERRLLLEPRWAETVLRGFGALPRELLAWKFKLSDSRGARLVGLA